MILDLEATFSLGLGGFEQLQDEQKDRLLGWWKVKQQDEHDRLQSLAAAITGRPMTTKPQKQTPRELARMVAMRSASKRTGRR